MNTQGIAVHVDNMKCSQKKIACCSIHIKFCSKLVVGVGLPLLFTEVVFCTFARQTVSLISVQFGTLYFL